MNERELTPRYLLKDDWEIDQPMPTESGAKSIFGSDEILQGIRAIRIEVAPSANTRVISTDAESDCLLSEIGMNLVVPRGSIQELRFKATLLAEGEIGTDLIVLDGYPKGHVEQRSIVDGKVTLGVSKLFTFIPAIGPVTGAALGELLKIELNPWEFKIGNIREAEIIFSGSLTFEPEWYFRESGLNGELQVTMTIKKPVNVKSVAAQVEAAWAYSPGFLRPIKTSTDAKMVRMFPT